jgi:hypothetical protein
VQRALHINAFAGGELFAAVGLEVFRLGVHGKWVRQRRGKTDARSGTSRMRRGLRLGASVTSVQGAPGKVVKLSLRRHYPGQVQRVFRTAETLSPQNRAPRTAWRMACDAGGSRQGTALAAAGAHLFTVAERAVGAPAVAVDVSRWQARPRTCGRSYQANRSRWPC